MLYETKAPEMETLCSKLTIDIIARAQKIQYWAKTKLKPKICFYREHEAMKALTNRWYIDYLFFHSYQILMG